MNGLLRLVRQHKHLLIGLALGLLALLTIVATLGDIGLTWDEPLYIKAARGYMSWLGLLRRDPTNALSDSVIVRWWVQDPTLELHPPLGKLLSGLTWAAFRTVVGDISAHRLANAGLFSLLVAMVYWLVSSAYGTPSGVFAALALLLMPRMFLHGHLSNIDTTVAITWFATVYLFCGKEPEEVHGGAPGDGNG
ncbi:MAG TPA: glycosyltransferase family 39 protein, partial [Anaerolineae bacterium]|nr:glycosyltransferase family 39 protein [Anaerolineae bacterium]